jgi:hypothetical protein
MKVLQFLQFWLLLLAFLALSVNVAAHQELSPDELVEYHRIAKRNSEALNRCLQYPDMHEHHARMLVHRDQTLKHIRKTRGIDTEGSICPQIYVRIYLTLLQTLPSATALPLPSGLALAMYKSPATPKIHKTYLTSIGTRTLSTTIPATR